MIKVLVVVLVGRVEKVVRKAGTKVQRKTGDSIAFLVPGSLTPVGACSSAWGRKGTPSHLFPLPHLSLAKCSEHML